MGYNGLCRFNRSGGFNVPFGSHKRITYTRDFSRYKEVFSQWDFTVGDFEQISVKQPFGSRGPSRRANAATRVASLCVIS
jgi:site-specific DNA-adenine methylase